MISLCRECRADEAYCAGKGQAPYDESEPAALSDTIIPELDRP